MMNYLRSESLSMQLAVQKDAVFGCSNLDILVKEQTASVKTDLELGMSICLQRLFTPSLAQKYEQFYQENGVKFVKGARLKSLEADSNGHVTAVRLEDGSTIEADTVVVGIGAKPAIGPFDKLAINNEVEEHLELGVNCAANGLITEAREDIDPEARPFARKVKEIDRQGLTEGATLVEVVRQVKPDVLLGLSAVGGLFSLEAITGGIVSESSDGKLQAAAECLSAYMTEEGGEQDEGEEGERDQDDDKEGERDPDEDEEGEQDEAEPVVCCKLEFWKASRMVSHSKIVHKTWVDTPTKLQKNCCIKCRKAFQSQEFMLLHKPGCVTPPGYNNLKPNMAPKPKNKRGKAKAKAKGQG